MDDFKTVEVSGMKSDTLRAAQNEDLAKMRESLLACSHEGVDITTQIQKITALRVHHQLARIIRYLEMMDKIEDKLYESLDITLDHTDIMIGSGDEGAGDALRLLLSIQERLQRSMIESHKLLEPYLNVEAFEYLSSANAIEVEDNNMALIDRRSRDKIRMSAREVLSMLAPAEEAGDA